MNKRNNRWINLH